MNVNSSKIDELSKHHIWLSLLHYDKRTKMSSVINKDFFLSPFGNKNPTLELRETILSYYKSSDTNHKHPVCSFPARYKWLSEHMELDNYKKISANCTELQSWNLLTNVASISLVFVNGFLDNPASAFGHSFLKINKFNKNKNDLFDTTISYGAQLPKHYTMLSYIYNGVTGGYTGVYSDKYYYMDTMVYSNQEFREMWEYVLSLSKKKVEFLLFHLWELRGIEFQYYFFNKNCAFKGAELLELVYEKDLRGNSDIWYAPIETFFRLREIEKQSQNTIFSHVNYIPSQQQKIYTFYHTFSQKIKKIINNILENESYIKSYAFDKLKDKEKIKILDFILDYLVYKGSNNSLKGNMFKQSIVLQRLSLPAHFYEKIEPKEKRDLTLYDKPTFIFMGYANNSLLLGYAPFTLGEVGHSQYSGDILKILSSTIAINKNKVSLHELDIIKIRHLKIQSIPSDIESPYSWSIYAGIDNREDIDYFFDIGGGFSWEITSNIKVYNMLHASLHSNNNHYRVNPNFGIYVNMNTFRFNVDYGYENMKYKNVFSEKFSIQSQYKFQNNFSIFFNIQKRENKYVEFGFKWFL